MIDQQTKADERATSAAWGIVAETIRTRRSNLHVDLDRPIPPQMVEALTELAVMAPNHHRTNPWRFTVLSGPARLRLGELVARELAKRPEVKESYLERQRAQFLRAPTVLVVASAGSEDPIKHLENKHAVAAGIENLLLGATAAGLASAWKSGPAMVDATVTAAVKAELGLDPGDEIVGIVYLGHPIAPPGSRTTPRPSIRYVDA